MLGFGCSMKVDFSDRLIDVVYLKSKWYGSFCKLILLAMIIARYCRLLCILYSSYLDIFIIVIFKWCVGRGNLVSESVLFLLPSNYPLRGYFDELIFSLDRTLRQNWGSLSKNRFLLCWKRETR